MAAGLTLLVAAGLCGWLMTAHIVLIALGFAGAGHTNAFAELWDMIWTYPGMLLATAGTAALIMVVVTSIRAARRRLRYESWRLLHLYAYLGAGLALPHQLWAGTDFIGSTASTVDREINAYALPVLRQETLDAQSADIDTVSGATVTGDGYRQSLQSALDAAHLS